MWEVLALATVGAYSSMKAADAAENAKQKAIQMQNAEYARLSNAWAPTKSHKPAVSVSAKCPCCGSRQFVTHQSRRVCTYCRSEQDGELVQVVRAAQAPLAGGWGDLYGGAVLRPEMAVRIAEL